MAVFKIILMMTTLLSLSFCEEQLLSIELSLPDIMSTFNTLDQALRTLKSSDNIDITGANTLAENLLMKVKWKVYGYLAQMLTLLRRKNQMRPMVEMAPGAIKTEIVTYPPNYFVNRLKTLLKIKQKQEEMNRDLNAPK